MSEADNLVDDQEYSSRWGSSAVDDDGSQLNLTDPQSFDNEGDGNGDNDGDNGGNYSVQSEYDDDDDEEEDIPFVDDLPIFADETSKKLHAETKRLDRRRESAEKETNETTSRLAIMLSHLKNVSTELTHTNSLLSSKKKETLSLEHLHALTSRSLNRFQVDIETLSKEKEDRMVYLVGVQNQIYKANTVMDSFKLKLNWNQNELEQWSATSLQKEEDNLKLEGYTRGDEREVKELSLKIEQLTSSKLEVKTTLDNEITETQSLQITLDRTAQAFKELHAERQNLVRQWSDAIDNMRKRDSDISKLSVQFTVARNTREVKYNELEESRARLQTQELDNTEITALIENQERTIQKQRTILVSLNKSKLEIKDELDVVKNELEGRSSDLNKRLNEVVTGKSTVDELNLKLVGVREVYHTTVKKVAEDAEINKKGLGYTQDAEVQLKVREKQLVTVNKQLQTLKNTMFRTSQHLFKLRQDESTLISSIAGSQSSGRNLTVKLHGFDSESVRQQELLYNAEFQIQQMERKVSRGLGERSDEEKRALVLVIKDLESKLDEKVQVRKMVQNQSKLLNVELKSSIRVKANSAETTIELTNKIAEVDLEIKSCENELSVLIGKREEGAVNLDVMRLEVKRLRDKLNSKASDVFNLENRRQQLKLSMEERKSEINVHSEVRVAQLRAVEEERHKVKVELSERKIQVDKLKTKYESTISQGDGGEEHSQAYYVIMAAQKREELQREGDELDHSIRKKEKEMHALEHTLEHLNVRNTEFRLSFQKADLNDIDGDSLRVYEEQSKMSRDVLFRKKKELQRLQTDYEEDMRRLEQVEVQSGRLEEQNGHLDNALEQVEGELGSMKENLQRVEERERKLIVKHRGLEGAGDAGDAGSGENEENEDANQTLQEKLFTSESLETNNTAVLKTLGALGRQFPEIYDELVKLVSKNGLILPMNNNNSNGMGGGGRDAWGTQ